MASKELSHQDLSQVRTEITPDKEGGTIKSYGAEEIERVPTVEVDNYHGLPLECILVYLSIQLLVFAQMIILVAPGVFSRDVAQVVGGSSKTTWLLQTVVIFTTVLSPPVSQAADYWGRKWFMVILPYIGSAGCIIVSRSTSMVMAIAGQAIAAISAGSQPLLYAVGSEILPRRYRPIVQGGINMTFAIAGSVTLIAGAEVIKKYHEGYRIIWYIGAALFFVSASICAMLYNPPPRPLERTLTFNQKIKQLDWIGYILLATGITLFSMALTWSDNPFTWRNVHILGPFILGLLLLIALAFYEKLGRTDGMFHHTLFRKDRNIAIAIGLMFVEGMSFFAANNFFPFEICVIYETDPVKADLRFCVVFFAGIFSSAAVSIYSTKTKRLRSPLILAFAFFIISFALMSSLKVSSQAAVWGYPIFLGLGLGICLTIIVTTAQLSAPPSLIAITSGLLVCVRALGGAVGLPIYTAILNSQLDKHLGADIAAAVLPLGFNPQYLPQFIGALTANDQTALSRIPGVTSQIIGVAVGGLKSAYLKAFHYVYIAASVFSALAFIASCFVIDSKDSFNMHVDAPLEAEVETPSSSQ